MNAPGQRVLAAVVESADAMLCTFSGPMISVTRNMAAMVESEPARELAIGAIAVFKAAADFSNDPAAMELAAHPWEDPGAISLRTCLTAVQELAVLLLLGLNLDRLVEILTSHPDRHRLPESALLCARARLAEAALRSHVMARCIALETVN